MQESWEREDFPKRHQAPGLKDVLSCCPLVCPCLAPKSSALNCAGTDFLHARPHGDSGHTWDLQRASLPVVKATDMFYLQFMLQGPEQAEITQANAPAAALRDSSCLVQFYPSVIKSYKRYNSI